MLAMFPGPTRRATGTAGAAIGRAADVAFKTTGRRYSSRRVGRGHRGIAVVVGFCGLLGIFQLWHLGFLGSVILRRARYTHHLTDSTGKFSRRTQLTRCFPPPSLHVPNGAGKTQQR